MNNKNSAIFFNTKVTGKNRHDNSQNFYIISGNIYVKGLKSNGMLVKLDNDKILNSIKVK